MSRKKKWCICRVTFLVDDDVVVRNKTSRYNQLDYRGNKKRRKAKIKEAEKIGEIK